MNIPCKNCLILPICKQRAKHANILTNVASRCELLKLYIYDGMKVTIPTRFYDIVIFYEMEKEYDEWFKHMKINGIEWIDK